MSPHFSRLLFSVVLAPTLLFAIESSAQTKYVVRGSASCRACTLELRRELTIGGDHGPAALGGVADVFTLPDGGYAVTDCGAPETDAIFSKTWSFVRSVGRAGRGPGEFRYALFARPRGGGLIVFDPAARRAVVFDEQFAPRRTIALPGELMGAPVVLGDAHIALNSIVRTQERIGLLVHIVDTSGRIVRSIAPSAGCIRFDVPGETYYRSLAETPRGSFWVA